MAEKLSRAWMSLVVRYPAGIIFTSLVICILMLSGLSEFRVDASVKKYIGEESKVVVHLNWLEQEYVDDNNVFMMFEPEEGTVFNKEFLEAIRSFTEGAWRLPYVRRVDSIANFQHTAVQGDELDVNNLVPDTGKLSPLDVSRIRENALAEPRLVGSLVSPDGDVTAINMLFTMDISDDAARAEILDGIDKLKDQLLSQVPSTRIYQVGFISMMDQMTKTSANDGKKLYSTSILLIVIALAIFFRSLVSALVVVLVGVLGVLGSVGVFALLGGYLTPPTAMGLLMVLILGLVDGIHIVKNAMTCQGQGMDRRSAIFESSVRNFVPVGLTSLTTAIGFLSFNFNDFVGIQLMGNYVAGGVMLAYLLSISLLPALLCFCPLKAQEERRGVEFSRRFTTFVEKYHRWILGLSVFVLVSSAIGLANNEMDDSISRHLKDSHPFRQDVREIEDKLTGSMTAIYSFESSSIKGVADVSYMNQVEGFAQWLRNQPGVRHVDSYTDTLKQLNQDLHGGDSSAYSLPDTSEASAQYLLMYEVSLPYGLDLTNQINLQKTATRVVAHVDDFTFRQTNDFLARNSEWLEEHAPGFDSYANSAVLASNITIEATIWNTLEGALVALAVIGLVLVMTFRALVPGLLCIVSVVVPMLVAFGIWGLTVGIVDLPATLALCMVIGISVDFSVHFISKYLYAKRGLALSTLKATEYTVSQVTGPLMTGTVALGIGFLIMTAGQFQFGARLGLLTAICIFLSLLTVFSILPSMILILDKK